MIYTYLDETNSEMRQIRNKNKSKMTIYADVWLSVSIVHRLPKYNIGLNININKFSPEMFSFKVKEVSENAR